MATIGPEFQTFIYSAYRFEQAHGHEMRIALNEKSNRRILKLTRFYLFLMHYAANRLSAFLLAFFSAVAPTLPVNFLSFPPGKYITDAFVYLNVSCDICWALNFVLLSIKFVLNWVAWTCFAKYGVLCMNQIMIGSASLAVYVSIINAKLQMCIDGTSQCVENSTYAAIKTYRQVQILVSNLNRAHSALLVFLLVVLMSGLVLFTVSSIQTLTTGTFTESGNFYINCFFADAIVHFVVVILSVYGLCGNLHQEASGTLGEMKRAALFCGIKQARIARRCTNALPVLKIEFGGTNFVEKRTAFVYLEFALERIIDTLLIS
ncbi:unnamed protein product [Orchesella dallaii]|uniref:Gustatory receptor n=1 Tax=Orchesella dallaii TaxID=48710 RepID=A0ABP1RTW5_9HEXA